MFESIILWCADKLTRNLNKSSTEI